MHTFVFVLPLRDLSPNFIYRCQITFFVIFYFNSSIIVAVLTQLPFWIVEFVMRVVLGHQFLLYPSEPFDTIPYRTVFSHYLLAFCLPG